LDFGDLSQGTTAVRRVTVSNNTVVPHTFVVMKVGKIADLIDIDKNNFTLTKGQQETIELSAYIPASAEIDEIYTGRVYVFKVPRPF
jgi:hypothetical protein